MFKRLRGHVCFLNEKVAYFHELFLLFRKGLKQCDFFYHVNRLLAYNQEFFHHSPPQTPPPTPLPVGHVKKLEARGSSDYSRLVHLKQKPFRIIKVEYISMRLTDPFSKIRFFRKMADF